MKVQIKEARVDQREVRAKGDGKVYVFRTQTGWIQLDGEVRKIGVQLDREQLPYEVGMYTVGDASFKVDNFGNLSLGRLQLSRDAAVGSVPARQGAVA